jgi:hypothetical protein
VNRTTRVRYNIIEQRLQYTELTTVSHEVLYGIFSRWYCSNTYVGYYFNYTPLAKLKLLKYILTLGVNQRETETNGLHITVGAHNFNFNLRRYLLREGAGLAQAV